MRIGFVSQNRGGLRDEIGFVSHFWHEAGWLWGQIGFVLRIWVLGQAGAGVNWVRFAFFGS